MLGEVGSPRRSVGSPTQPHFENSTIATVTLAGRAPATPEFTIREKLREMPPITGSERPLSFTGDFCQTSCRRGSSNIHSFSVFLTCFVLFCFDSRRRLPSDVCLPLSGDAFCACAKWISGKQSHSCDSTGVNSSWRRQHVPVIEHYVTVYESVLSPRHA